MPFALLLAMQAAGMVIDWAGTKNQQQLADMGYKVQQAGIESSIEQTRLETEDASLQALKNLRQNLGSQMTLFAARGTQSGTGTAAIISNESVGTAKADERVRRLNLLGNVNRLKAGGVISKLNQMSDSSQLWQGFAQRTINRIPVGTADGGSSGASSFSGSRASSYGLTQKAGN